MLDDMDDADWQEWMAYEEAEPLNPHLAYGLGLIASLLFNINREKGAQAWTPETVFPFLKNSLCKPMKSLPDPAPELTAKRRHWQAKIASWKTGNMLMPSVR